MEQEKINSEQPNKAENAGEEIRRLKLELEDVRIRLEEANDTIEAIQSGEVDALIIRSAEGPKLFTLKGSDEVYRVIIEQMNEGAATMNEQGIILYSNSTFAAMTGLPPGKVTGRLFQKFLSGTDQGRFAELFARTWKQALKTEAALVLPDGSMLQVQLSLKKLSLDEGEVMSLIMTDLTQQKETQLLLSTKNDQLEEAQEIARDLNLNLESTVQERTRDLEISVQQKTIAEQELRRNQEQLTRVLETMAEGVRIIDPSGKLLYANPMAQKILGIRHVEGSADYEEDGHPQFHLDGRDLLPANHPMQKALQTGKPVYDYEIAIQPVGQERFFISVNAAPLRDEHGTVVGSVGTFMDVTTRRKVIQQKDEFISVASHELKTPVTSLKAALQLLNEVKDNASGSSQLIPKLITSANRSLDKLSVLISDLLNVSKIRDGQLIVQAMPVLIHKLIEDCIESIHQDGSFEIITNGPVDLLVMADELKIDQVLINFINNAIKYAPYSKKIEIGISDEGSMVKICVRDQGPGIAADKIGHVFDRYFRVDNSGTQYSGLGLGLYICSQIIRKHGGEIGVESEIGKGSCFWFTLPKPVDAIPGS